MTVATQMGGDFIMRQGRRRRALPRSVQFCLSAANGPAGASTALSYQPQHLLPCKRAQEIISSMPPGRRLLAMPPDDYCSPRLCADAPRLAIAERPLRRRRGHSGSAEAVSAAVCAIVSTPRAIPIMICCLAATRRYRPRARELRWLHRHADSRDRALCQLPRVDDGRRGGRDFD